MCSLYVKAHHCFTCLGKVSDGNTAIRLQWNTHPEVGQLKSHLNEAVWTDSTLLDFSFAKFLEGENMEVHIISQRLGHSQRLSDLLFTLSHTQWKNNISQN